MTKIRQDAWSKDNDMLLAETVLRHIREGSTQLNAFEEVGDVLNRTSAACGFRWNAVVRNEYHQAIELAKRQRKERKRQAQNKWKPAIALSEAKEETDFQANTRKQANLSFDQIYTFLQDIEQNYYSQNNTIQEVELLKQAKQELMNENKTLTKQLKKVSERLHTVESDYQTFIQIMDRARKLTLFEDQNDPLPSPMFKMDKNGNLEQYVQG